MTERYKNRADNLEGPAAHGFAITPSNTDALPQTTRALYVGADGDVRIALVSGAEVTLAGILAGTLLPLRANKVLATGTTAGQIVGLV